MSKLRITKALKVSIERRCLYFDANFPSKAWRTLPTIEDFILSEDGKPGFTVTWHSHSDQSLTVVEEPLKTQHLGETKMIFADSQPKPKGLTERWSLRLKAIIKPVDKDTLSEFGLTVAGRAKLYVNGELIIDNWTKQMRGDAFFGMGTVEERGVVELKAGKKHELFIDFTNVRDDDVLGGPGISALRVGGAEVIDEDISIKKSIRLAESADIVVIAVGLNADWESEGFDRTTLRLPGRVDELVERVAKVAGHKTVVVTQSVCFIE